MLPRKIISTQRPGDAGILTIDTVEYLYLPYSRDTIAVPDALYWNKFKSLARYFLLHDSLQTATASWEEGCYDSTLYGVYETGDTIDVRVTPVTGLETRSWRSDSNGRFLAGRINTYYLDSLDRDLVLARGFLRMDLIVGRDRNGRILGRQITYGSTDGNDRGLPRSVRNANGALSLSYYDFRLPDLWHSDPYDPYYDPSATYTDNRNVDTTLDLGGSEWLATAYAKLGPPSRPRCGNSPPLRRSILCG